ncbi:MAG: MopE-related protein [Candidatus Diapherotrites archaeon]
MRLRGDRIGVKSILLTSIIFFSLIISFGGVSAVIPGSYCPDIDATTSCDGSDFPCSDGFQTCLEGNIWGDCSTQGDWCGSCEDECDSDPFEGNYYTYDFSSLHKYCDADGECPIFQCNYQHVCADGDLFDGWPIGVIVGCAAECDSPDDCDSYCSAGEIFHFGGTCAIFTDCSCAYETKDCDDLDGWYYIGNTRWINLGECTEKEQKEQESRDYYCDINAGGGCNYDSGETRWIDTGATRNKEDGTICGSSSQGNCDGDDTCQAGSCEDNIFQNGVECRPVADIQCDIPEYCDGINYNCPSDEFEQVGTPCDDGLFCNVGETCNENGNCAGGTEKDCSLHDILGIATCTNNPDLNPFTWDSREAFISGCNDEEDLCTSGDLTITHTCNFDTCNAECDSQHDCSDTDCGDSDECYNGKYRDYDNPSNSCNSDCSCTQNLCESFTETGTDADQDGVDIQCGDECDNDANKIVPGICGCGVPDVDTDSDGVFDCEDNCINTPNPNQADCNDNDVGDACDSINPDATEICDGIDNNCNGQTDENLIKPADNILGLCLDNTQTCSDGVWHDDEHNYVPTDEFCSDGEDNDCDGLIDCEDPDCTDETSPITIKTYGLPLIEEPTGGYPKWITSQTQITLSATDPQGIEGECVSGLDETYYRVTQVDDRYCWDEQGWNCQEAEGSGDFLIYEPVINILDYSCHLIEYYSVDNKGTIETIKKQCVFVDNIGPVTNKTVGEVKTKWFPDNFTEMSYFYPEETAHCWDGTLDEIECWKVTLETQIKMECYDPAPHPVGFEELCFKVDWDGTDITNEYCGELTKEYCCVDYNITEFYFHEESEHNLEYYCEDKLGNRQYDEEKFKVFGEIYIIDLEKKWNLISVPFNPLNKTPEAVFSEIQEDIGVVWSYDAEMNKWYVYRPDSPLTNDLEEIKTGLGYWIMALDDATLNVGGSLLSPGPIVPPSRKIVNGWNLIGYYGTDPNSQDAYCALFSLVDTSIGFPRWSSLWGYESSYPPGFVQLDFFGEPYTKTGKGYWLEIDVEDEYAPATGCIYPSWYNPLTN